MRVQKSDGCWLWIGRKLKNGYGVFKPTGNRLEYVHRYSYRLQVGEIPSGLFVCHSCDNPPCVRPDHLFLGTPADNVRDMWSKGRGYVVGGSNGEDNPTAKATIEQVRFIREHYSDGRKPMSPGKMSGRAIAKALGLSHAIVHQVISGKTWKECS